MYTPDSTMVCFKMRECGALTWAILKAERKPDWIWPRCTTPVTPTTSSIPSQWLGFENWSSFSGPQGLAPEPQLKLSEISVTTSTSQNFYGEKIPSFYLIQRCITLFENTYLPLIPIWAISIQFTHLTPFLKDPFSYYPPRKVSPEALLTKMYEHLAFIMHNHLIIHELWIASHCLQCVRSMHVRYFFKLEYSLLITVTYVCICASSKGLVCPFIVGMTDCHSPSDHSPYGNPYPNPSANACL